MSRRAPAWKRPCRWATARRWSACASAARTPPPARPARVPCSKPTSPIRPSRSDPSSDLKQDELLDQLVHPVARAEHAERADPEVLRLRPGQLTQVVVVDPVGL